MIDEIQADYEQLEQVSSRFNNQSQAIQQMLQRVKSSMDKLEGGGWIGRGSDSFFNEMQDEVLPASTRLQDALAQAGQLTQQIAQTVRTAEEEAGGLFGA